MEVGERELFHFYLNLRTVVHGALPLDLFGHFLSLSLYFKYIYAYFSLGVGLPFLFPFLSDLSSFTALRLILSLLLHPT
jgi:hypothetical protein